MTEKTKETRLMKGQNKYDFEINKKMLSLEETRTNFFKDLADRIIPLADEHFNNKMLHLESPKLKLSFWIFGLILFIIVIICGILVFFDKLEGSNFTFLLGVLIGSVMVMLGDVLIPQN